MTDFCLSAQERSPCEGEAAPAYADTMRLLMLLGGSNRLLKTQIQLPMLNHPDLDDEIDTICDDINLE